jgi:hypothetical protein
MMNGLGWMRRMSFAAARAIGGRGPVSADRSRRIGRWIDENDGSMDQRIGISRSDRWIGIGGTIERTCEEIST